MIRKGLLFAISLFFIFVSSSGAVLAQTAGQISVDVVPPNPGPNQSVTIYLKSYSFNINTADIEWSVDGTKARDGVGLTSFTITTKNLGGATKITAKITPINSISITKTIVITPMSVDMLWQATDSIVPPFYRGKAMPTSESKIKIVAIPQIVSLASSLIVPENLVYDWKEEYRENSATSGYGKNSFYTEMDYLNDSKHVSVEVSSRDGGTATSGAIDITPVSPELRLYASSPLYGPLTDRALTNSYTISNNDTSIVAMPYFFSPGNPASSLLEYKWQLNGSPVSTPSIPNSLFLHRESESTGSATLDLSITNITKLFQTGTIHLNLVLQ